MENKKAAKCIDCENYQPDAGILESEKCKIEGCSAIQPNVDDFCSKFQLRQSENKKYVCGDCINYNLSKLLRCNIEGRESHGVNDPIFDCPDFQLKQPKPEPQIRQFDTGATRDTDVDKLDYEGFLSPIVLQRYAQYLNKHRVQSDGNLRDSDNWQKGIPIAEYMKSKARHFMATWLIHRGVELYEKGTRVDLEETLCAEIFNSMGYLFEILKKKQIKVEIPKSKYCSDCEKQISKAENGGLVLLCEKCKKL